MQTKSFYWICVCVWHLSSWWFAIFCCKVYICTLYLSIIQGAIPSKSLVSMSDVSLPSFTSNQPVRPHQALGCGSMGVLASLFSAYTLTGSHEINMPINFNTGLCVVSKGLSHHPARYFQLGLQQSGSMNYVLNMQFCWRIQSKRIQLMLHKLLLFMHVVMCSFETLKMTIYLTSGTLVT